MSAQKLAYHSNDEASSAPSDNLSAIFFDVDGVILDSLGTHLQFCEDKAKQYNMVIRIPSAAELRAKVAARAVVNPMKEFLRTVGFRDEYLERADEAYKQEFATLYRPQKFAAIEHLIEGLHSKGIPLGLVTSNTRENVSAALGDTMKFFQSELSFFYGTRKARALAKGAAVVGQKDAPQRCLFIGDVPTDMDAALEAGVRFLGVTYGWGLTPAPQGEYETVDDVKGLVTGITRARTVPYPFQIDRSALYSVSELWTGYEVDINKSNCLDAKVFRYFKFASKYSPRLEELRTQRCHDAGIEDAIDTLLELDDRGYPSGPRKPIMILGSHSTLRRSIWYTRVAHLTYELARAGYFVATGGGPGTMEAANLGAYMVNYTKADLNEALEMLRASQEPSPNDKRKQYEMPDYWETACRVADRFPMGGESLGVPTWFYGHEGANRYASHVAKFLSNGLRESKMTSIGTFGAIFAPGGPGTSQEVFTDAAENTYFSFQWLSPMVFFNDPEDGNSSKMIEIVKAQTSPDYNAQDMILKSNDVHRIVQFLIDRPPQFRPRTT